MIQPDEPRRRALETHGPDCAYHARGAFSHRQGAHRSASAFDDMGSGPSASGPSEAFDRVSQPFVSSHCW